MNAVAASEGVSRQSATGLIVTGTTPPPRGPAMRPSSTGWTASLISFMPAVQLIVCHRSVFAQIIAKH